MVMGCWDVAVGGMLPRLDPRSSLKAGWVGGCTLWAGDHCTRGFRTGRPGLGGLGPCVPNSGIHRLRVRTSAGA
jgi:hypothetical protein